MNSTAIQTESQMMSIANQLRPTLMSVPTATAPGLPVVNQALEPAWVRHGSAATQKAYESALAFEEVLVEQLSSR